MKLLLFDIDQTLLKSSKGHRDSFSVGFREAYGVEAGLGDGDFSGMTDTQIAGVVLRNAGLDQRTIDAGMADCVRSMEKAYVELLKTDELIVLPGVAAMLEALNQRADLTLGLITGNLEPIAWGKMGKVGLARYFKLGGFGNESVYRWELVRNAIRRAEQEIHFSDRSNVYVFGDTPFDIEAARRAEARGVGVATGKFTVEQLLASGAEAVLSDFTDIEKVMRSIGS
jgi:phosphoglycolate phosphatase